MNAMSSFRPVYYVFAVLSLLFFLSSSLYASLYEDEKSTPDYLFLKGLIRSVSLADKTITVLPKNGHSVTLSISSTTELKGFKKIEELQAEQAVKIWYHLEQGVNIGLKIFRLPELGC